MKRNKTFLSYWLVLIFMLSFFSEATAQRNHFVYLQTDEQLPFYVVHKGRNYSSSGIGYLILPKLADSTYSIKLGFPGAKEVENFDLVLKGEDQGFLVKKFTDKGWGLFNLKTMDVQISGVELGKRSNAMAAQKAAAEQRIADSLAAIVRANEEKRVADSLEAAFVIAEKSRKADSLAQQLAFETQKAKDDSLALEAETAIKKEKELAEATANKAALQKAAEERLEKQKIDSLANEASKIVKKEEPKKVVESVLQDPNASAGPELHQPTPEPKTVKKVEKESREKTAIKLNEAATDSGYVGSFKDGGDTIKAFIPNTVKANQADAESDTITIRVPAKTVAKQTETVEPAKSTGAEKEIATNNEVVEKPKSNTKLGNDRFLDMEINADTTGYVKAPEIVREEKTSAKNRAKDDEPKQKPADDKKTKKVGLVSNNANTKIIETEPEYTTAPNTEEPKEAAKEKKPARKNRTTETEEKRPGLSANNPNTKIVVEAEKTGQDEEKKVSKKEESKKEEVAAQPIAHNAQCKQVAESKDFFALRKKMASAEEADEMIAIARKAFKTHCYTNFQLRNLSVLFLTDGDRYNFLDAAYAFAADDHLYGELADLLTETYYLNRFKAMLR